MNKPTINKSRRKVIKGTAVAATAAAVGPWVVSPKALSSSGEVNCTIWTDYIPANVIEDLAREHKPEIVLAGATAIGRSFFPRLATLMATGLTADCTDLEVRDEDGEMVDESVIRIGPFTAVADSRFVNFNAETGELEFLVRQPSRSFLGAADDLQDSDPGELVQAVIDPSSGTILSLLVETPDLVERINQGGLVGYIVIALAALGLLIGIGRTLSLTGTASSVRRQAKSRKASKSNPLGRVFMAYEENSHADVETLELKLDDAILKEMPKLEKGLNTVKVLAGVAPLLGRCGYSASKHALHGLFTSLRCEMKHKGVHVMIICPGFIKTNLQARALGCDGEIATCEQTRVGKQQTPEFVARKIHMGAQKERSMMVFTLMGNIGYLISRFAPSLYERLMTQQFREELE